MHFIRPRPFRPNSFGAWLFAIVAFLAALGLRFALSGISEVGAPYITFIPAIILTTYFSGVLPAVAIGFASLFAARYFFVEPRFTFTFTDASGLSFSLFAVVVAIDIGIVYIMRGALEQLDAERAKSAALAEQRETMFKELQHRVSNNLAIVSALLNLQRNSITDERASQALSEASNRLGLIARIHRKLHDPAGARRSFGPFMEELCRDVLEAAGVRNVVCLVSAADARIAPEKLIPISLIVTELISNALEHGLANQPKGTIRIDLTENGTEQVLTVADDGRGLPADFSLEKASGLGLRIVQALVQQVQGRFAMENGRGTTCRIVFDTATLATAA
jgi:two-component sensor histidine kinase